ncbi:hypothetical protein [Pseudoalteromonas arctica]|uniref:DNA gyrase subunit B n=1 Tax=Pseudoalteromonas arctica TaxID=394751 RepID=A0A7Y0DVM2_9GAMM|nr:hypothetical protein [Pseudoalteromonas arctica]NMM42415.1 hypothetical protein [Pseudoalteromonas arctica]
MLKAISITLALVCLTLYPFIVYFGLQYTSVKYVSILLITLVIVRLLVSRQLLKRMPWLIPASVLAVIALTISTWQSTEIGLRLYPVIINTVMAITFAFSLRFGPSVIESFARIGEPELDSKGVWYTRQVTKVWCGFFIANASVALYTSLYTSLSVWTLYNGLIAYILIGFIMAIEWLVRQKVRNNAR